MASLKEVKSRIESVQNTRKITLARQMISAAYLHRSQDLLKNASVYFDAMEKIVAELKDPSHPYSSALTRETGRGGAVAVVIMSSNSGMCGSFNARIIKELPRINETYNGRKVIFYPIGKKIRKVLTNIGFEARGEYDNLAHKMTYRDAKILADELIASFESEEVSEVELIYSHYVSASSQVLKQQRLLPYTLEKDSSAGADAIIEPAKNEVLDVLVPSLLYTQLYTAIIDNQTAEHAARTIAMQMASENANELLDELQLTYNKLRQQNITNELLDIIGSSFA